MADDFPTNSSTTGALTVNQYTTARADSTGDADWFAVTLTAGTKYRIDVDSDVVGSLWDPHLFGVYDSTGTLIAGTTNYNGGIGRDARKWFTATASGTYYVSAGTTGTPWDPADNYRVRVADDWDDYSADITTAASVIVDGAALEAVIDESIDTDWIAVTLTAGQVVQFDVTGNTSTYYSGGTFNTDVKIDGLYDSTGTMIAGTTVTNTGTTREKLTYTATTAGTYYLSVSGEGAASEGKYQVAVRGDDLSAGTDTTGIVTSAGGVLGDQPMRARDGEIFEGGDEDWIATPLLAGETYEIEVTGQGGLDPRLTGLFDPSGTLIAGTSASGSGDSATISYTPTADGTYFTGIAGETSTEGGDFRLRVWRDMAAADTTTTGVVTAGDTYNGRILTGGDTDWIAISMMMGAVYEVTVSGQSGFADPRLTGLYDSTGTMIAGTANSGTGNTAVTTYTATAAGTYYVGVAGETATDGGNYQVDFTVDDYAGDTTTSGVVVADGSTLTGTLEEGTDHDWFALTVTAGQTYHVKMFGDYNYPSGRLYYADLSLRDDAGAIVSPGLYDRGGRGQSSPAEVLFTAAADGTYYIDAHSRNTYSYYGSGGYDLTVQTIADDYSADINTTGTVAVNGSAAGKVDFYGDKDWFAATLEEGESYRIELEGYGAGTNSGVRYPGIAGVYDATGTIIAGTGAGGGYSGYPAQTAFTATADATYYISAGSRYSSYTGDYELSVTQLVTLNGTGGNDWMGLPSTLGTGLFAINGGTGTDMMSFSDLGAGVFINLHSDQASSTDFNLIMDSVENVTGTSHNDVFHGSDRSEKMRGLGGRDMFYGSDGERDTIDGGSSTDTLSYQYSSKAVSVSLLRGRGNGGDAHGDRISNIENLIGSNHDDMLWGDGGANRLEGGLGDDTLIGNGGDDYILAGLGTDVIVFSGNQSEYTITRDGISTTVDHTGGTGLDGTDLIGHAEVLRFADGDFLLS